MGKWNFKLNKKLKLVLVGLALIVSPFVVYRFIASNSSTDNNFSGVWEEVSYAKDNQGNVLSTYIFRLELEQNKGILRGKHCSRWDNDNRIDCITEFDSDKDKYSITGKTNGGAAQIMFTPAYISSYSPQQTLRGSIKLVGGKLYWKIDEKPDGEFYVPMEATLTKLVDSH